MPIVRQVPELYIRGSLANVTMKNLTPSQQKAVTATSEYVASHPRMAKHRAGVMEQFKNTIGADYSDDRKIAEMEYQMAIWKASVELLYHHQYTFVCKACGSSVYQSRTGRLIPINRQGHCCRNCEKVYVTETGDTDLEIGSCITWPDFQDSYKHFTPIQQTPKCRSAVEYITGEKKYTDKQVIDILADPKQLAKFFGEFVWNYFRQQIAENKRKEYKRKEKIIDRADRVIVEEILSLCRKHKLNFNYCKDSNPNKCGKYIITVAGLLTPPEFTAAFTVLRQRATANKITICCEPNEIQILVNLTAGNLTATISKSEHILVLENTMVGGDEENNGGHTISQIAFKTVGAERMDPDNHVELIASTDLLKAVRKSLPQGECREVFDINTGQGLVYVNFSKEFGDNPPRKSHIARFLGITPRLVSIHQNDIKIQYLAHSCPKSS